MIRNTYWMRALLGLLLFWLTIAPAGAQQSSGLIRLNVSSLPIEFNPLSCIAEPCDLLNDLLLPKLVGVDPVNGAITTEGDYTLAAAVEQTPDRLTITIRDDLTWSDGTPVTAYDAMFTLGARINWIGTEGFSRITPEDIARITAPDPHTLLIEMATPSCRPLTYLSQPIIPYYPFDADYPEQVSAVTGERDDTYPYRRIGNHPYALNPVTLGAYRLDEIRVGEYIRLRSVDSDQALQLVEVPREQMIADFLNGNLTVFNIVDRNRVRDFERVSASVIDLPTTGVYGIRLNFADANAPRDWDTEDERGQGVNLFFGDPRVREAVRLALDVEPLIAVASHGYGTPTRGIAVPQAWYANPNPTSSQQNVQAAKRLLSEAGWRYVDNDRLRECRTCTTAPIGRGLVINLGAPQIDPTQALILDGIVRQLQAVGIGVDVTSSAGQDVDAVLTRFDNRYPYDPSWVYEAFRTEQDLVGRGRNIGSYHNPQVDALLTEADQTCEQDARAALYQTIEQLLLDDGAVIPLYAPHVLYAAGAGVQGFDPRPHRPLWNLSDWVVTQ